jgi:ferrous iron transport protein A
MFIDLFDFRLDFNIMKLNHNDEEKYQMAKKIKYKKNDKAVLADLSIGQKAKVVKLNTIDKALRRRLLDMGITEGVQIKVKRVAPLGDPYDIELRGYELCLRKKDLMLIDVEVM